MLFALSAACTTLDEHGWQSPNSTGRGSEVQRPVRYRILPHRSRSSSKIQTAARGSGTLVKE